MFHGLLRYLFAILVAAMITAGAGSAETRAPLVFISAFAAGDKGGIHAYQFDLKTGALKEVHRTTGVEHPFFLALSPDRKSCTRSTARRSEARSTRRSPPMRWSATPAS
jgi:hypothetical protein